MMKIFLKNILQNNFSAKQFLGKAGFLYITMQKINYLFFEIFIVHTELLSELY